MNRQEQIETLARENRALGSRVHALERLEPGYRGAGAISPTELSTLLSDNFFTQSDGLLLLGPHDEITPTSWTSRRGQVATISGAFHQVAGAWPGTRALMVETAATNHIANPSFEVNVTDFWSLIGGSVARSGTRAWSGDYSLQLTAGTGDSRVYSDSIAVANGETITAQARCWRNDGTKGADIRIWDNTNTLYRATTNAAKSKTWERLTATWTNNTGGAVNVRVYLFNKAGDSTTNVWFDAVQLEKNASPTSYLDGSLAWASWSATAHNSISTRTASELDLDNLTDVITQRSSFTVSIVIQAPYDSNGTWQQSSPWIYEAYCDANHYHRCYYIPATERFVWGVTSGGVTVIANAYIDGFSAGDWIHLVLTADFDGDMTISYNGELYDTADLSARSPSHISTWAVGSRHDGTLRAGWAIGEYAVLDSILTAEQVAALYHRNAPLVDAGAFEGPLVGQGSLRVEVRTGTMAGATPTLAEIVAVFGYPHEGFVGLFTTAGGDAWMCHRLGGTWYLGAKLSVAT